ncbi:MAG: GNAT family N-acetyltransferase [Chloroflexota bacterium]
MAIVRLAREADIPRIIELYRELAITTAPAEEQRSPSPDDYRRVFAEIKAMPGYQLVVVEHEGVVVGTLELLIAPNLAHGGLPWAVVENVVVDHRYQGQGLGKKLMDYAVEQASKAGCYKISLSSNIKRHEAHEFYRSLGFTISAHSFSLYF